MPTNTSNEPSSGETSFTPGAPKRFDSMGIIIDFLSIEIREDVSENFLRVATKAVRSVLGNNWSVEATDDNHEFDVSCSTTTYAYRQYWEFCHRLLSHRDIVFAHPEFYPPDLPDDAVSESGLQIGYGTMLMSAEGNEFEGDPRTEDKEWALKQCKVPEAWQLIRDAGKKPGEGIVIGHPDSGYRPHSEMDADRINTNLQWDFVSSDNDPVDPYGNHGLGTASVIMSGESEKLKGPALHSTIVPLRVKRAWGRGTDVVLGYFESYRRLRRALVYSEDHGFDVISISLGGFKASYRKRVRKRLIKLWRKGVLIIAAAGNRVSIVGYRRNQVVFPARWPETVAVAASTVERTTWDGSCFGSKVDISAPGDSVWRAIGNSPTVEQSAGTSFSTALVAGIAALWKSYRRTDLAGVEPTKIAPMFMRLVKQTAQTDHELRSRTGAGIIDAHALLNADIPTDVEDQDPSPPTHDAVDIPSTHEEIGHLARSMSSLAPIADTDLSGLGQFEAYELEAALELEIWYNVTKNNPVAGTILDEVSPQLNQSLQGLISTSQD